MKQALLFGTVLISLGCQSGSGTLTYRGQDRPDDPCYSIEEQKKRTRSMVATIEDSGFLVPPAYVDRPGVMGR